eukprot:scaffold137610_cov190-Phaeocystis_antarctica.AAC.1
MGTPKALADPKRRSTSLVLDRQAKGSLACPQASGESGSCIHECTPNAEVERAPACSRDHVDADVVEAQGTAAASGWKHDSSNRAKNVSLAPVLAHGEPNEVLWVTTQVAKQLVFCHPVCTLRP